MNKMMLFAIASAVTLFAGCSGSEISLEKSEFMPGYVQEMSLKGNEDSAAMTFRTRRDKYVFEGTYTEHVIAPHIRFVGTLVDHETPVKGVFNFTELDALRVGISKAARKVAKLAPDSDIWVCDACSTWVSLPAPEQALMVESPSK